MNTGYRVLLELPQVLVHDSYLGTHEIKVASVNLQCDTKRCLVQEARHQVSARA